jgi:hypothetical protein
VDAWNRRRAEAARRAAQPEDTDRPRPPRWRFWRVDR